MLNKETLDYWNEEAKNFQEIRNLSNKISGTYNVSPDLTLYFSSVSAERIIRLIAELREKNES